MAKKTNVKNIVSQQVDEESVSRKKKFMKIGVAIFLIAVIASALVFFLIKGEVGVGKAVQITEQGQEVQIDTGQTVSLSVGKAYAAVNDKFSVSLVVNTAGEDIGQIDFKLNHPNIILESQSAQSILTTVELPGNDGVWTFWTSKEKIKGETTVAKFDFKLAGGDKNSEQIITFSDIFLYVNKQNLLGPFEVSSTITVADICIDGDNDGWGAPNTDLRACLQSGLYDCSADDQGQNNYATECGINKVDCNDNEPDMYPGNNEKCDGLDNNCIDGVDEGVSGSKNNVPNVGVCMGKKLCIQGDEYDSYDIPVGTTVEIDGDEVDLRGYIKNTPKFAEFAKYTIGLTDFVWSFDVYGPEVCDTVDNNCDGYVNENEDGCSVGQGGVGLRYTQGEILLKWNAQNEVDVLVDHKDLHLLDLITERNDLNLAANVPNCGQYLNGFVCTCPNGNYFLADANGDNVEFVNYIDGIKSSVDDASVNLGDFVISDDANCNPQ